MTQRFGPIIVGAVRIGQVKPSDLIGAQQEQINKPFDHYETSLQADKPGWISFAKGFVQKLKGNQDGK